MKMASVSLLSLSVLLVNDFSAVTVVDGIKICQSHCIRIWENRDSGSSSFLVHCSKLFSLKNPTISTTDAAHKKYEQNLTLAELLKTCSAESQLRVTRQDKDVCVETKDDNSNGNYSRLLIIGSRSYQINLKTHEVQEFLFPYIWVRALVYLSKTKTFLFAYGKKVTTSPANKIKRTTTLKHGVMVLDILVDEDRDIVFLKTFTKSKRCELCTMSQIGTKFKSLGIKRDRLFVVGVDKKNEVVYVGVWSKITAYTYEGTATNDLHLGEGKPNTIIYDPLRDVLYYTHYRQLKMITKSGNSVNVTVIRQLKKARFMKIRANYLYITSNAIHDKVFKINVENGFEVQIITVPYSKMFYRLCLF